MNKNSEETTTVRNCFLIKLVWKHTEVFEVLEHLEGQLKQVLKYPFHPKGCLKACK